MKTIGERIQQARKARGLSGRELAIKAGYEQQSAIGNLENRATGNGGNRLRQIADVLRVPVAWLMEGPDSDVVPFKPPMEVPYTDSIATVANEESKIHPIGLAAKTGSLDPWTQEVLDIMLKLKEHEKPGGLAVMRTYVHSLGPPRNGQTVSVAG